MTCKIERLATGERAVVFRVFGHIQPEHVDTIEELIASEDAPIALDLTEVTLVDRGAVSRLAVYELTKGVELRNCPLFLRDWVTKEQLR